jgi:hypothetical protein
MGEAPPTGINGRCGRARRSSSASRTGAFDEGHAHLVELYLRHAGFERIETHRLSKWVEDVSDPMIAVVGRAQASQG